MSCCSPHDSFMIVSVVNVYVISVLSMSMQMSIFLLWKSCYVSIYVVIILVLFVNVQSYFC